MERKGIIKLLWIALAVHILYFTLLIIFVSQQHRLNAVYFAGLSESLPVLSPYIIVPDLVLFLLHALWTVKFVKKLSGTGISNSLEWKGVLLFGGVFLLLARFGNGMVRYYVGHFFGDSAVMSDAMFRKAVANILPLRPIAVTLLLLATGMSIYCNLRCRSGAFRSQNRIVQLWWKSLIPEIIFLVVMILIVVFQNRLKDISGTEYMFVLPITFIVRFLSLFLLHIVLTVILVYQQKQGTSSIVCEILGVILFSGILGWPQLLIDYAQQYFTVGRGIAYFVNHSLVNLLISRCYPICIFGRNLFIIGCGMSIYRKLHMERQELSRPMQK